LSQRFEPLKRSQELCIRTIGKIPWGHLRNWPGPNHCRLKGMSEPPFLRRECVQGTLLAQGGLRSCFPKIHFTILSCAGAQRPVAPPSPGSPQAVADPDIIPMMMALQACRM
jgi:hypothetical protein